MDSNLPPTNDTILLQKPSRTNGALQLMFVAKKLSSMPYNRINTERMMGTSSSIPWMNRQSMWSNSRIWWLFEILSVAGLRCLGIFLWFPRTKALKVMISQFQVDFKNTMRRLLKNRNFVEAPSLKNVLCEHNHWFTYIYQYAEVTGYQQCGGAIICYCGLCCSPPIGFAHSCIRSSKPSKC